MLACDLHISLMPLGVTHFEEVSYGTREWGLNLSITDAHRDPLGISGLEEEYRDPLGISGLEEEYSMAQIKSRDPYGLSCDAPICVMLIWHTTRVDRR